MNEELAGAGYVLQFFENLINLNNYFSELKRRILNCKEHATLEDLLGNESGKITKDEIKHVAKAYHSLNFYIDQTYIFSQALKNKIPSFQEKKLTELYEETEKGSIPEINHLQEYVILINTAFADDVMQRLLVDSKDIYSKLKE